MAQQKQKDILINFFADVFIYTQQLVDSFTDGGAQGFDEVRGKFTALFEEVRTRNISESGSVGEEKNHTYSDKHLKLAIFAVVAYVDEQIIASNWNHRVDWNRNPLQRELFGSIMAGSEFYANLEKLQDLLGYEDRDTYEVYFYVLSLGFEGVYYDSPDKISRLCQTMHARLVRHDEVHNVYELREGEGSNDVVREFQLNKWLFSFALLAVLVGVVGSIYYIEAAIIANAVDNFIEIYGIPLDAS